MAEQPNGLTPLRPRRRLLADFIGGRELLMGAAAIGLVIGVSWVDEQWACAHIEEHPGDVAERDAALDAFVAEHCGELGCEEIELVSRKDCLAKIRVQARRVDEYGENLGTFESVEGLAYSPVLGRWRIRERLDDKQLLGLPNP
jgi:hypothetical protein